MAQSRVVDRRHVPGEVRDCPQRERDERVREEAGDANGGREPQDAQRGRPLREDDVLEQVDREQVVQGNRVKRPTAIFRSSRPMTGTFNNILSK